MIYIGVHATKNINDGYMGSGKHITSAIKKHGVESFKKEILETFSTMEDMFKREREIVTEEFIFRKDTYNIVVGGRGGSTRETNGMLGRHHSKETKILKSKISKEIHKKRSAEEIALLKNKISTRLKEIGKDPKTFLGKKHSDETKKLMSKSHKGQGVGHKNSQYGTCWITNGVENKKIKKDQLDMYLKKAYKLGRTIF